MLADPSSFHLHNVTDTCSVWNILSSQTLYTKAQAAGCSFCITGFVKYELLDKPRKKTHDADKELKGRLRQAHAEGKFSVCACTIDDLQAISSLQLRKSLGKGELSSIAIAKRINLGFLSDDAKALKLSKSEKVIATQDVPHLLSWLMFSQGLTDGEASQVIHEHVALNRSLKQQLQEAKEHSQKCLLNAPPRSN
jgi:predicted nucleic acid-binding protein